MATGGPASRDDRAGRARGGAAYLLALWQDAPLTVKRLSELLQLDPGTLSPLFKRLEAAGYVRRQRDPHDDAVRDR